MGDDDGIIDLDDDDVDDAHAFEDTPETEPPGRRRLPGPPVDGGGLRGRRTDGAARGTYRALRRQFLAKCRAGRVPCHFGDGDIDYSLLHGDSRSATVHHIIPVALRPDLELDVAANWAVAHDLCNKLNMAAYMDSPVVASKPVDPALEGLGELSEEW